MQYLGSKLARFCELKQRDKAHAKTVIHYYSIITNGMI